MMTVYSLVEPFGIDAIPEVYEYVELLGRAVERHLWEKHNAVSPQKRVHNQRKRFIAIFKGRYHMLTDLEYTRRVTQVDAKVINQANRTLRDHGFTNEEFLKWVFEDFLMDNPKFCPPILKSVCSAFFIEKFLFEHKDLAKNRAQDELAMKDAHAVIGRGRVLLRNGLEPDDDKKIREALKAYSEKRIILRDLRKVIEAIEGKQGNTKAQEAPKNG
jgi:hypothetical protein